MAHDRFRRESDAARLHRVGDGGEFAAHSGEETKRYAHRHRNIRGTANRLQRASELAETRGCNHVESEHEGGQNMAVHEKRRRKGRKQGASARHEQLRRHGEQRIEGKPAHNRGEAAAIRHRGNGKRQNAHLGEQALRKRHLYVNHHQHRKRYARVEMARRGVGGQRRPRLHYRAQGQRRIHRKSHAVFVLLPIS